MDVKNFFNDKYENIIQTINSNNGLKNFFDKNKLNSIRNLLQSTTTTTSTSTATTTTTTTSFSLISNFESQLIQLQSLLIWEKPRDTIIALITFTCFYWSIVLWQPRLISVLASLAFCYHFYEMWICYVWPEIRAPSVPITESWTDVNPNVMSAPEIKLYFKKLNNYLLNILNDIIEFRKKSHGLFCCLTVFIFFCFYYIGYFIPGTLFIYLLVMILFLIPGFLAQIIPKNKLISLNNNIDDNDNNDNNERQRLNNDDENENKIKEKNLNDNNLEPPPSSSSQSTSLMTFFEKNSLINDNDEINENYFENNQSDEQQQQEQSIESDFVIISDNELI